MPYKRIEFAIQEKSQVIFSSPDIVKEVCSYMIRYSRWRAMQSRCNIVSYKLKILGNIDADQRQTFAQFVV